MPTITELEADVHRLAIKARDIATDAELSVAQKRTQLQGEDGKGGLEADLKSAQQKVADARYVEDQVKSFASLLGGNTGGDAAADQAGDKPDDTAGKSYGQQFVTSKGFQALKSQGFKGENWSSGQVEFKTTLTEGTSGAQGGAYGPTVTPQVIPGVVDIRFRPLTLIDLFNVIPVGANSNSVRYLIQNTATFNAAATAETGTYPEDALGITWADERLGKITTSLPVSDEALEDIDFLRGFIDMSLLLDVKLAEEGEVMAGSGTAPHLTGLLNRSGLSATFAVGDNLTNAAGTLSPTGDKDVDAVYRMTTQVRTHAFLEPDHYVMNSVTWQSMRLSKDNNGQYYAGGPFGLSFGQQVGQPAGYLWGKPVVISEYIATGTVIVGCFAAGANLLRKGGITLDATNSHGTDFLSGIQRIRAQERLGLMVHRPQCFGVVTNVV